MSVIDFNEFYIDEIVLIRAFQRAIKRRDTISGTLFSSFKRQLAKILWNRGSTFFKNEVAKFPDHTHKLLTKYLPNPQFLPFSGK